MKNKILEEMFEELSILRNSLIDNKNIDDENKSLQNLNAYVKLLSLDITNLQDKLTNHGLSSLGRAQSCVNANPTIVLLEPPMSSVGDSSTA